MRLAGSSSPHLTYCLNVHAGESWDACMEAIKTHVPRIRSHLETSVPFGLGLRISNVAAQGLLRGDTLPRFSDFLANEGLYAFTVNGFPYGPFHGEPVKTAVYEPDWRAPERLEYTCRLVDILAALLPDGVQGSISTVPGSYGPWIQSQGDRLQIARNIARAAKYCSRVFEEKGAHIHLGLEPEPDCFLQTTDDVVAFFDNELARAPGWCDELRKHVGICFDTCHLAVQFEDLASSLSRLGDEGILVSKIQLSAAIRCGDSEEARRRLREFCDPVYLHQVKVRRADGRVVSFADLPEALDAPGLGDGAEWRVHCHVPLYYQGDGVIDTTADSMDANFFGKVREAAVEHLEVETYTFDVLPAVMRERGVDASIADEYRWALVRL